MYYKLIHLNIMKKTRLIIFPHAGGGISYYYRWKNILKDFFEVSIVQYPMREQKITEKMPDTVEELASNIFYENVDWYNKDYVIWGHSMGSSVGYEVMKLSEAKIGKSPKVFFSSGAAAPSEENVSLKETIKTNEGFISLLEQYGGIDDEMLHNKEFLEYFSPIIKTDMTLLSHYKDEDKKKISCPLVLMQGSQDKYNIRSWNEYADNKVEKTCFEGGHFFIEDYKHEISDLIKECTMKYD